MQIQNIQINDTAVSQEDSTPVVSFTVDINILCDTDLEAYKVNGQLDTTSLKDAALKLISEKLHSLNLDDRH